MKVSIKGPTFFNQLDEGIFFRYVESISYVGQVRRQLDRLYFDLKMKAARTDGFRELLGCFNRFRIKKEPWIVKLEKQSKAILHLGAISGVKSGQWTWEMVDGQLAFKALDARNQPLNPSGKSKAGMRKR